MISPLLTMIITVAAVATRTGIKRLIRCSSCIITMIYKYYHERSVSQTGQGGPFSFSIDMNLPAKFDGHIGGKKHAAYHYCMQKTQQTASTLSLELAIWQHATPGIGSLSSQSEHVTLYTKFKNGVILFQLRLGPSTFCSVWLETFSSCLSKWCKKFRYLLFADGHSCGSQEIVNEAGLDTKYSKTTLRLETVERSSNLEQYSQSTIESRPLTQATLLALAADSWPGPAALDRKLKVFTILPSGQARGSSDVHLTESEPSMPIALLESFPQSFMRLLRIAKKPIQWSRMWLSKGVSLTV